VTTVVCKTSFVFHIIRMSFEVSFSMKICIMPVYFRVSFRSYKASQEHLASSFRVESLPSNERTYWLQKQTVNYV
jgi:hypothetical protein